MLALALSLAVHAALLGPLRTAGVEQGASSAAPIQVRWVAAAVSADRAVGHAPSPDASPREAVAQPQPGAPKPTPPRREPAGETRSKLARDEAGATTALGRALPDASQMPRIYAASELSVLPAPAGEPLIDLRAYDDVALDGSVQIELLIESDGRVTSERLVEDAGLPREVVAILRKSFGAFPYAPGQVEGMPVASRVTLSITLRDGRAAVGLNQ